MLIYWAYVHSILMIVNGYSECSFFNMRFCPEISVFSKILVMRIYILGDVIVRCVMNINAFPVEQVHVLVRPHLNLE